MKSMATSVARGSTGGDSGKARVDKSDKCPDCGKGVTGKDPALMCEICEKWFHTKCESISEDMYQVLKSDVETIHWFCESCNRGVGKLILEVRKTKERIDKLDQELCQVKDDVKKLKDDNLTMGENFRKLEEKFQTGLNELKDQTKQSESTVLFEVSQMKEKATSNDRMWETKLVEKLNVEVDSKVKDIKEDVDEKLEIDKRKSNLIFFGVTEHELLNLDELEEEPDLQTVKELLKIGLKLDGDRHIEEVTRLGKFVS